MTKHPNGPFEIDLDELPGRVTRRTKAIVVNSPSNPTGAVFTPDAQRALVTFATDHNLTLISDEV